MPRNRTARVAVLAPPVQRAASAPYSSRQVSALKRRIVAGVLVVLSLALITVYFRESDVGRLHDAQSVGASALQPFEIGAERIARPFRDLYGYVAGVIAAKSENERLRVEVDRLRQQVIQNESALQENVKLRRQLDYLAAPTFPRDFHAVSASVIAHPPSQFDQSIVISAGTDNRISLHDAVMTADGLVGQVTRVTECCARVTLLTDDTSAVSALGLRGGAIGIVRHGQGNGNSLIFDGVRKEQVVPDAEIVVTSGTQEGELPSLYPKGIPIGIVTNVGQTDTDFFKRIQILPFVDFTSLETVLVLVSDKRMPRLP